MKTTSLIFGTRFFLRCPPNKHYTTTANRMGRSIWVSGYFRHWPFTCYSWSHFFTHCSEKHEGLGRAVSPCSMAVLSGRVLSGKRTRERRQSREKHFSLLPSQSPRSLTAPAVLCSRPAAWRLPHVKAPFAQVFSFERVNYAVEPWRILKFYWESI